MDKKYELVCIIDPQVGEKLGNRPLALGQFRRDRDPTDPARTVLALDIGRGFAENSEKLIKHAPYLDGWLLQESPHPQDAILAHLAATPASSSIHKKVYEIVKPEG